MAATGDGDIASLRAAAGALVAVGGIQSLTGFVAVAAVGLSFDPTFLSLESAITALGIALIVAGCAEFIIAFVSGARSMASLSYLAAAATIGTGCFFIVDSSNTTASPGWELVAAAGASGVVRAILGLQLKRISPLWPLMVVAGLLGVATGAALILHWTVSGLLFAGLFISASLYASGGCWLIMGQKLKQSPSVTSS